MSASFVILAGGSGNRLGGAPKQYRLLSEKPVWQWSYHIFQKLQSEGLADDCVLVIPQNDPPPQNAKDLPNLTIVHGGPTRSQSVKNGLIACKTPTTLLHDAARPFLTTDLCRRLLNASNGANGVIPLLPLSDAIKKETDGKLQTQDRTGMLITQTPQLFPKDKLLQLLQPIDVPNFADEAELWLSHGLQLDKVEGERTNFKITDQGDWQMASQLAQSNQNDEKKTIITRTGLGYDIHPLTPDRPLILGGIKIEDSTLGLYGHSDADIICHTISDAILGACGLPDIGLLFPASDDKYKNCNSLKLLQEAVALATQKGWQIHWIDLVLTAQYPRLAKWRQPIMESLETVLGQGKINIKFKSGESIPPIGDCKAIQSWAVATVSYTSPNA